MLDSTVYGSSSGFDAARGGGNAGQLRLGGEVVERPARRAVGAVAGWRDCEILQWELS